jgi:hypothetical protein
VLVIDCKISMSDFFLKSIKPEIPHIVVKVVSFTKVVGKRMQWQTYFL